MNDIVTHLRNSACGNDCRCAYCVRNKIAADEIEQLRELLGVTERLLTSERDEARREACERTAENLSLLGSNVRLSTLRVEHAARRGWNCYAEPRCKSDPNIISLEELQQCTRNQTP